MKKRQKSGMEKLGILIKAYLRSDGKLNKAKFDAKMQRAFWQAMAEIEEEERTGKNENIT